VAFSFSKIQIFIRITCTLHSVICDRDKPVIQIQRCTLPYLHCCYTAILGYVFISTDNSWRKWVCKTRYVALAEQIQRDCPSFCGLLYEDFSTGSHGERIRRDLVALPPRNCIEDSRCVVRVSNRSSSQCKTIANHIEKNSTGQGVRLFGGGGSQKYRVLK
jgi:hypothetical protein